MLTRCAGRLRPRGRLCGGRAISLASTSGLFLLGFVAGPGIQFLLRRWIGFSTASFSRSLWKAQTSNRRGIGQASITMFRGPRFLILRHVREVHLWRGRSRQDVRLGITTWVDNSSLVAQGGLKGRRFGTWGIQVQTSFIRRSTQKWI